MRDSVEEVLSKIRSRYGSDWEYEYTNQLGERVFRDSIGNQIIEKDDVISDVYSVIDSIREENNNLKEQNEALKSLRDLLQEELNLERKENSELRKKLEVVYDMVEKVKNSL